MPKLPEGITHKQSSAFQTLAENPDIIEQVKADAEVEDDLPTRTEVLRRVKEKERNQEREKSILTEPPEGKYRTIVVDPPWPVEKIQREVRPLQLKVVDYEVMSIDEIKKCEFITKRFDTNCHVYLWTTHKFLPIAFSFFEEWGIRYECLLTWVKNVGMTPFSFMYSTEHCLFGRKGHLELSKKGERLDFFAKVREHSRKPDEFYELVKKVSPAPRIDIFARGAHDGFDKSGNETEKF